MTARHRCRVARRPRPKAAALHTNHIADHESQPDRADADRLLALWLLAILCFGRTAAMGRGRRVAENDDGLAGALASPVGALIVLQFVSATQPPSDAGPTWRIPTVEALASWPGNSG